MQNLYLATRFYVKKSAHAGKRLEMLDKFIANMRGLQFFTKIGVAVHVAVDRSNAIDYLRKHHPDVEAIAVTPWGRYVPALSALLEASCMQHADAIMFASIELELERIAMETLVKQMDSGTLVAGLCLPGHDFVSGAQECIGSRCPWNTGALWRVKNGLDRIGYPAVGEALFDQRAENVSGVEEVGAISVLQTCYPDCAAKLIKAPGVAWKTPEASDPDTHQKKIEEKVSRPAAQLHYAKLPVGKVLHIDCT